MMISALPLRQGRILLTNRRQFHDYNGTAYPAAPRRAGPADRGHVALLIAVPFITFFRYYGLLVLAGLAPEYRLLPE